MYKLLFLFCKISHKIHLKDIESMQTYNDMIVLWYSLFN